MTTGCYVYEHWRPDKGVCFYVGKGEKRRAYSMRHEGRNRYHVAIQEKLKRMGLSVEVRIILDGLSSDEAFEFEIERISFWKSQGIRLTNRTSGGDGSRDHSPETIELMRAAKLGKKASDEVRAKMRAAHSRRPKPTPEVIEKARLGFLAAKVKKSGEQRLAMSNLQKSAWAKKKSDSAAMAAIRKQRSEESKRRWKKLEAEGRAADIRKKMWTPERRALAAEKTRQMHLTGIIPKKVSMPRIGPPKPRKYTYVKKFGPNGPNGNSGKRMCENTRAAINAYLDTVRGNKLPAKTVEKMRRSWTPERRARQAEVARAVCAKRYNSIEVRS